MKIKITVLFAITILLFISCSTSKKIEAIRPEADQSSNIAYTAKTSYIGMPVAIEIADIQNILNKTIQNLVYRDSILEDDNMEIKVWKTAPITLSQEQEKIKIVFPVKIWLKYKYGTQFMGLNDTREFNLNAKVTVLSNISLSNWQLNTKSIIERIEWQESPTVQIAGKNVAITYIISPALNWFKQDLAKQLDDAITKSCDFKPQVIDALKSISNPYLVNDKFETWLSLNPLEIYATNSNINKGKVYLNLGIKAIIKTIIGDKPSEKLNWNQLKMTKVKSIPNHFNGTIAAITGYKSASRIITTNFKGETFSYGNKKVVINQVEMWHKNNKIIIALTMNGSLNGTIYLSGTPKYNNDTQEIYFEHLDYVLDTKNVLHKSANWLLNGMILKKIQENCKYSIATDIENAKQTIQNYFNNYSPIKGVYVSGKLDQLSFEKFELLNNGIVSFINTTGTVAININGLE
jgi:hypothetical protein